MEKLFPVLAASKKKPLVALAPMVRAGSLAMRSLCQEYGSDLLWGEEIVDRKFAQCVREQNTKLGTIDFVITDKRVNKKSKAAHKVCMFRTHVSEKERVIFQMGTGSAEGALKAAKIVENDVAGIDINMGCPKKFR